MLIAAGVLAIGMFGVMALIPLISMRLQEGEIADRSAVLGRNAVEEIQVRGWTDPRRWRWYRSSDAAYVDPTTMAVTYAGPPAIPLGMMDWPAWDDNYLPVANPVNPNPALVANLPFTPSVCVDPMGITGIVGANANRIAFPYAPLYGDPRYAMQRVLPFNPAVAGTMDSQVDRSVAELLAIAEDDLLFDRPESRNELSRQTFSRTASELNANGVAPADYAQYQTRRFSQRDYSFLATLTPLDNVTSFQGRGNYLLSAVVFYQRKRVYDATTEIVGFIDEDITSPYSFSSGGVSGGEVAINCSLDPNMVDLAKGDWVMLTYPAQVVSGVVTQAAYHRWYQVIEAVPYDAILEPNYRFVTLAGPDWPFVDNPTATPAINFPDDTQVTWLPSVALVSEKTINLSGDGTWE